MPSSVAICSPVLLQLHLQRQLADQVNGSLSPDELQRRPAIRTLTVRYILSLLKYLHEGGKADLLQNGALCRALFQNIRSDPPDLVTELLTVSEQHVFKDEELKRSAKAALLAQQNLERVTQVATQMVEENEAAERAYAWLVAVSTKPSYGVLRHCGWYPSGTTHLERRRASDDTIDLGLDSLDFYDRDDRPAVRNPILLSWILTLHPWSNLRERELILTCFRSAPELVAAYFAEKEKSLQLDPKLSNTWIGYASFLFEVVQLPVPERFGHGKDFAQLPPQTTLLMESLLPRPLTQKVLSRCLNQSSELITFFAVRILVLSMQKLRSVRQQLEQGAEASEQHRALWKEASQRLLERFVDQAPPMKDVIGTFRKIAGDVEHALQREAIARLLRLYYEVAPLQAQEEQFDVSSALTAALGRTQEETQTTSTQMTSLQALELEHLLQIARHSPGMRWFGKQGALRYSPVITLLQLHAKSPRNREMRELLTHVVCSGQVLKDGEDLEYLLASVQEPGVSNNEVVWDFLDDCLTRASKKPIKYLDDLEALTAGEDNVSVPSLLCGVLLEQTPFLLQREGYDYAVRMMVIFFSLAGLNPYHDDYGPNAGSGKLEKRVQSFMGEIDLERYVGAADVGDVDDLLERVRMPQDDPVIDEAAIARDSAHQEDTVPPFDPPPRESDNHPELLNWVQKDLDMALEDGKIAALVLCLCSKHFDVRTQALAQLRKLEDRLINSTLEDKDPVYVLIGELIETFERNYLPSEGVPGRLEYLAGAFVCAALKVQTEPTHVVYPKLNAFLNKDPEWRVHKLPGYWIQQIVLSTPESEDEVNAYWLEVHWVLDWIADGLRTAGDVEILRRAGVFERLMAVYAAPGCERGVREKVVEVLWRVMDVEGEDGEGGMESGRKGAEMLVKRCGVVGWLDMVKPSRTGVEGWLRRRVLEYVDGEIVGRWAGVDRGGDIG